MTDLGPDSRALLDAIRDAHDPDEADRARVRAAVMRRIAIGAAAATAATAAQDAAAKTVAAKTSVAVTPTVAAAGGSAFFLKGVALLALVGAAGVTVPKLFSKPAPEPTPTVVAQPVATQPPATPIAPAIEAKPAEEPAEAPAPTVAALEPAAPEPSAPEPPAPKPVAPKAAKPVEAPATPTSMAADLAAIRDAHAALKAGDPARALALTDTISTSSPVAHERAVVRILAHCAMGKGQDVATRFLEAHPGTPAAARIRSACGLPTP